ncbi:hypothetical protein ACH5RR_027548 [Cinchona calisaya]|uniref:Prolyl endopeptidase n=1 Tax=Cinchona calisaya TaxID=153742 RepID=A0ABD2Z5Q9_9GENT
MVSPLPTTILSCIRPARPITRRFFLLLLVTGLLRGSVFTGQFSRGSLPVLDNSLQYPHTRWDESVVDNYHGVLIADPYRWLEDPASEETKEFVEKQEELTESVLKTCETRDKLCQKITELSHFSRYEAPFWAANKYFCFLNTGLQPQSVLYVQVFVPSTDGTPIPMFVVSKKDISLDGSHPCLLSAYGGFNFNVTPSFSVSHIAIARHLDAIFCIANIRGGGEYGEEWHKAGSLAKKQNCFDDFVSCGEYLIASGYTQPRKLCIEGGSNGGLLIGASINQRPDLFGCALAHVGVMDMLRFHKFTIGHAWTSDYGCSEKEQEFHWLFK